MWGYRGVQKYVVEGDDGIAFNFQKMLDFSQTNLNRFSMVRQKFQ